MQIRGSLQHKHRLSCSRCYAVSEKAFHVYLQESRQQEVHEARVTDYKTIERLKIQLEETEGLLSRKMTELKAAVEAKVTACETASELESKCAMLNQRIKEMDKGERGGILTRENLRSASFHSRSDRRPAQWFRLRSRQESDSFKSTESTVGHLISINAGIAFLV